jgi:hypothetical protein
MNSNEAIQLIVQDSGTMPDPTGGTANVTGQRSIAGALHGAQARRRICFAIDDHGGTGRIDRP